MGKHVPASMCACTHVWLRTRAVVGLLLGFVLFLSLFQTNIVVLFFDGLKDMGASFSQILFLGICVLSPEHRINKLEILGFKIKINNHCSVFHSASFPSHHLPSCLPLTRASLGKSSVPDVKAVLR